MSKSVSELISMQEGGSVAPSSRYFCNIYVFLSHLLLLTVTFYSFIFTSLSFLFLSLSLTVLFCLFLSTSLSFLFFLSHLLLLSISFSLHHYLPPTLSLRVLWSFFLLFLFLFFLSTPFVFFFPIPKVSSADKDGLCKLL